MRRINNLAPANVPGFRDSAYYSSAKTAKVDLTASFSTTPATVTIKKNSYFAADLVASGFDNAPIVFFNTDTVFQLTNTAHKFILLSRDSGTGIFTLSSTATYDTENCLPWVIDQARAFAARLTLDPYALAYGFGPFYKMQRPQALYMKHAYTSAGSVVLAANTGFTAINAANITLEYGDASAYLHRLKLNFWFRIEGATVAATSRVHIELISTGGGSSAGARNYIPITLANADYYTSIDVAVRQGYTITVTNASPNPCTLILGAGKTYLQETRTV